MALDRTNTEQIRHNPNSSIAMAGNSWQTSMLLHLCHVQCNKVFTTLGITTSHTTISLSTCHDLILTLSQYCWHMTVLTLDTGLVITDHGARNSWLETETPRSQLPAQSRPASLSDCRDRVLSESLQRLSSVSIILKVSSSQVQWPWLNMLPEPKLQGQRN